MNPSLPRQMPAACASAILLGAIALACLFGPLLSPHAYDRVYRDYILAGPSLTAHPTPLEATHALAGLARRLKLEVEASRDDGVILHARLAAGEPIDKRALRLFERSDIFAGAQIVETLEDGRKLEIEAPLKRIVFLLGTDVNGRDLLTRILVAGRISLAVGLLASLVALVIGVTYGAIAGYAGGRTDALMMRVVEIIYALPFIFLVIVLTMLFGRSLVLIFVAIGAVEWLDMARIMRGETLSIKERDYVTAAEALGASAPAILWRHVLPNAAAPIVAFLTLLVARIILIESFLSFLGLGVQEPLTSWGGLIADGARNIQSSVYLLVFPALFLSATLAALQILGDAWRLTLGRRQN